MNGRVNTIIQGDCLEVLKTLPDESVDCAITSPPYWGLRDYGVDRQLGLEKTPEEFVANLVNVFREVKRILKKDGTLWLNLGDSYAAGGNGGGTEKQDSNRGTLALKGKPKKAPLGLKPKDLVGIPWRVAFALQADGWYLRQDIIWAKPNPMPESVTDRCTKSHEYIFLLTKSPKYYFDNEAIKEPAIYGGTEARQERAKWDSKSAPTILKNGIRPKDQLAGLGRIAYGGKRNGEIGQGQESFVSIPEMRNKRSVWTITTKPFKEAHFATFPQDLIVPMVKAGCPEWVCNKCGEAKKRISRKISTGQPYSVDKSKKKNDAGLATSFSGYNDGSSAPIYETIGFTDCNCNIGFSAGIVLDPFMGSGTTAVAAKKLNRRYLGIELNPEYIKIAEKRIQTEAPDTLFEGMK